MIQVGQSEKDTFFELLMQQQFASAWTDDLMVNKTGDYKFASVEIHQENSIYKTNRQTYNLLEYLGDIGGLLDAMLFIAHIALYPVYNFNVSNFLTQRLFRKKTSSDDASSSPQSPKSDDLPSFQQYFLSGKRIKGMEFLFYTFCRTKSRKSYKAQLRKANQILDRELDLQKFIMRQRMQSTAILSLLTGRQLFCAAQMSQLLINESDYSMRSDDSASDSDDSSSKN